MLKGIKHNSFATLLIKRQMFSYAGAYYFISTYTYLYVLLSNALEPKTFETHNRLYV